MAAGISLVETAAADIPTPASGKVTVFVDSATGEPSYKNDAGTATSLKGAQGDAGPTGAAGADGADGVGVPAGGAAGQVLAKVDGTDYNTEWVDQTGGGGAVDSVNGKTGDVVLDAADVGAMPARIYECVADAGSAGEISYDSVNGWLKVSTFAKSGSQLPGGLDQYGAGYSVHLTDTDGLTAIIPLLDDFVAAGGSIYTAEVDPVTLPTGDLVALEILADTSGGASVWGSITGTLSDQTDLQTALNAKAALTTALGVVNHGATAGTARPSGYTVVQWIGSVDPTNKVSGDIWLDTSV